MKSPGLVLDADAVLAYAQGDAGVGDWIARRADTGESVLVPVLCLAEAYRQAPQDHVMLDLIQSLDNVVVTSAERDMAAVMGGFSRSLGRMDLAQVVITAAEHTVQILTSQRGLVTKFLPEEWPIIDL